MKKIIKITKNRVILSVLALFTIFAILSQTTQATKNETPAAESDIKYNLYTPQNLTEVQRSVAKAQKDAQIIFIVDFSNSMNEKIEGKAKVDMARDTLAELLPRMPKNIKTGLRVYGHRSGFTYLDGCQASNLVVPLDYDNYGAILNGMYKTRAVGWTPITYSLKQAVNKDFLGVSGKKHIVLLTDGGENCDESPCTYVINLMKTRDDITIDVIAFDISDIEANNQLKCTALMTSGKFLEANTEADLSKSLFETVGIDKDVRGSIKIPQE